MGQPTDASGHLRSLQHPVPKSWVEMRLGSSAIHGALLRSLPQADFDIWYMMLREDCKADAKVHEYRRHGEKLSIFETQHHVL